MLLAGGVHLTAQLTSSGVRRHPKREAAKGTPTGTGSKRKDETMAATSGVPNIQKDGANNASNPNQPPARIADNPRTSSLSQALANSKKQVDATK